MYKGFNRHHRFLFALGFLSLAAVTLYIIVSYGEISAEIPTHFNSFGEADAYGSKASLIALLLIGWALYALMAAVGAIPAVWNTAADTEKNREKIYAIARTMLSVLTFVIAAFNSCVAFLLGKGGRSSRRRASGLSAAGFRYDPDQYHPTGEASLTFIF